MHLQQFDNARYNNGYSPEIFLQSLENALPPVVSRAEASRLTGGLISAKTLSNEDALGKGPRDRIRIGSKIGYTRGAFMEYLRRKICMG